MLIKNSNLFYIRELQKKFYFQNNRILLALFLLEKFLFENFNLKEEIPISNLKQKWIYEKIKMDDYSNETIRFLKVIKEKKIKKEFLLLIEAFSDISFDKDYKILNKSFKNFNKIFNQIIQCEIDMNFKTFDIFQFIYLAYLKRIRVEEGIKQKINFNDKSIDFFEIVFLDIYCNNNNHKVSKIFYLFKLLKTFFYK